MGPSFNTVVSTAKAMLALERHKWRGLAGILIAECTYEAGPSADGQATQFTPVARVEIALHPGYRGDISIQGDRLPTSSVPQEMRAT